MVLNVYNIGAQCCIVNGCIDNCVKGLSMRRNSLTVLENYWRFLAGNSAITVPIILNRMRDLVSILVADRIAELLFIQLQLVKILCKLFII